MYRKKSSKSRLLKKFKEEKIEDELDFNIFITWHTHYNLEKLFNIIFIQQTKRVKKTPKIN